MLISVQYTDGRYDMVKAWYLDWLIASRRIVMFRRAEGWTMIGRDPVRSNLLDPPPGEERRVPHEPPLLAYLAYRLHIEEWPSCDFVE